MISRTLIRKVDRKGEVSSEGYLNGEPKKSTGHKSGEVKNETQNKETKEDRGKKSVLKRSDGGRGDLRKKMLYRIIGTRIPSIKY